MRSTPEPPEDEGDVADAPEAAEPIAAPVIAAPAQLAPATPIAWAARPPSSAADTPLMRQYLEVKERYPDCLIFFRVGDFYELFFDDAVTAARAIELTLTTRDKGKDDPIPMAGVPYHAARHYLAKLVEQGFKVAVCDQVEDARLAKGLVRREVTRVVTPGVVLDEEQLDARSGCYLVALSVSVPVAAAGAQPGRVGLAYLDVSTGEFAATELHEAEIDDELARLRPRELLLPAGAFAALRQRSRVPISDVAATPTGELGEPDEPFLAGLLGAPLGELFPDGPAAGSPAFRAAAAAARYALRAQPSATLPLTRLVPYRAAEFLILDEATLQNLELFETLGERKRRGSLFGLLDETCTAPGGRLLRRWLSAPLVDVAAIRRRHDAVEWLVERAVLREDVRTQLAQIYDLERLAGRITLGVASPRDLHAMRQSLEHLPRIAAALDDAAQHDLAPPDLLHLGLPSSAVAEPSPGTRAPVAARDYAADVAADIARTLVDDPPAQWKEGSVIRRGHDAELDELADIVSGGKSAILAIEERERARTGISSLKVRFNRVFGYYLEITRSNLSRVPPDYIRKQTLANAERFVTPELSEYERKVLGAEERRVALEEELFVALRKRVASSSRRLQALAEQAALLDALSGLAEVAHKNGYARPDVDDGGRLEIDEGRHPVVERLASSGGFVPNDVRLDPDDGQLLVITGPNMAGKSTVMRQVALITLMAQAGSFVPARRARVGVVDRIFTRVGASDNLSRGESTFMVEMRETAGILRNATRRSLVILDEIGRGTSTYDGLSIAWAVAEHLHDRIGAKTLFATHYHELCALARSKPRVRNFHVAVREWKESVVFLHKLVDGGASRSYGIQVARLAGLPRPVIDRARQVLGSLERGDDASVLLTAAPASKSSPAQLGLFAPAPPALPDELRQLVERLRAADPDELSPRDAHALLVTLRALIN